MSHEPHLLLREVGPGFTGTYPVLYVFYWLVYSWFGCVRDGQICYVKTSISQGVSSRSD